MPGVLRQAMSGVADPELPLEIINTLRAGGSADPGASAIPVLLDCDPGIDDAFAIVFACGHPGLDLRGVTTVAGNVSLDKTTANALAVLEFAGRGDIPVAAGSAQALLRRADDARGVHGDSGLGSAALPPAGGRAVDAHAVDFMIDAISASPGELTLVATGPLTNVALALRRHPPLARQVADFVIMGGSASRGNVTPAAEFNIFCDPEAAAIVFGAPWRVTMVGLDVTLQARAHQGVRERMGGLGRVGRDLLLPGLAGYRGDPALLAPQLPVRATGGAQSRPGAGPVAGAGLVADAGPVAGAGPVAAGPVAGAGAADPVADAPPVHDVCAMALVAQPELFGCLPARVEVETAGRWTTGMTVADFRAGPRECNALVALSIDLPGFWGAMLTACGNVARRIGPP